MQAVGNETRNPGRGRFFHRLQLAYHAPRPQGPGALPGRGFEVGVGGVQERQQGGLRVLPGVTGVKAFGVGEEDQKVCFHQVGDEGRQVVVVPELQLVGGHRVVFVDDGDHPPLQQRKQGIFGVDETLPGRQVITGQKYLGDFYIMGRKGFFIGLHEGALTRGGHRLHLGHAGGAQADPQFSKPRGHSPGGHQDKLVLGPAQPGDFPHQAPDKGQIKAIFGGEHWLPSFSTTVRALSR